MTRRTATAKSPIGPGASRRALMALAVAAACTPACGGSAPEPPPPPQVTVEKPLRGEVQRYTEFTGTTRAVEFAEIRARATGALEQVLFEPTSFVKAGDVLFEIERQSYQAAHDEAVARLASARSERGQAQADLERIQSAADARAVSQQELDKALTVRDQAQAGVMTASAQLEQAIIDLSYTRVTTPISGQVGRNLVDVGNLVGEGEPTLLTTVTRIQPIFVYFNAPEQLVLRMLELQRDDELEDEQLGRVSLATATDEGFSHQGRIDFIDNTVDSSTGTIEMRAIFENPDKVLFPGLFVRVRLLGREGEIATLVQERAIGADLAGKYVLVVGEDNIVEPRHVKLGPVQDDGRVVVEDGLDGSESYIVNGMLRARPGFPVTPQTAAEANAAKQAAGSGEPASTGAGES